MTNYSFNEYKDAVQLFAEKKEKGVIFPNSNASHASIVISELINQTEKEIFIYDKSVSGDLVDLNPEIIDNLEKKAGEKIKINIIVDNINSINSGLQKILDQYSNVKLDTATDQFISKIKENLGGLYYFTLSDGTKFRLESSKENRKAICSFNESYYTSILNKILCDSNFSN
ncbi:hypothetical protein HNP38_002397 [Chryseobacterium defluvii]|uniref:Uncharacterized protein n=1 Tax=Chryseobacterium defluvii TaxID=160396 RepID=A0A840KHW2_9FLAO|nr:hypothetical protein [Chryseobacterium defluvii]MBB4807093.1 hypothetical protein [Chryseobacterium defluvii]